MTARQVFEATLIELSKVNAPTLKLYEFNYLFNKAINQYVNKIYNIYDINQQTTDDIRVLKASAYLKPKHITQTGIQQSLQGTTSGNYEVLLPLDYLHILNCTCIYQVAKNISCYDEGDYIEIPATRLTADSWTNILTDVYNRPSPMKPYYYIHNINKQTELPTDLYNSNSNISGTDSYRVKPVTEDTEGTEGTETKKTKENTEGTETIASIEFPRTISLKLAENNIVPNVSLTVKPESIRISNPVQVRCEIRYGKDNSVYQLKQVNIDYIKSPQYIRLTQKQIDLTEDTSQIMEFPDYINQEIINELVHLVMERDNNPRLGNHLQMTQSIARPTQQQTQQTT